MQHLRNQIFDFLPIVGKRKSHFLFKGIFFLLLIFATDGFSQITSSGIEGKVNDEKNEGLPGVVILAIHEPTGTKYTASTDADGKFHLPNLKPGGPYKLTLNFTGYNEELIEGIYLGLGVTTTLDLNMKEETSKLQEVVVQGNKDNGVKTGTATNINREQIQRLPTISRSIQDFTRLTPQASNNSFAGTNFRYNNITVDGAINNDAISFSPSLGGVSGTSNMPGSSTRTNSISLDAVQDMQVQIAPYDVKLGNFTGGSINAVTRSGTNEVTGSIYGFGRNATITGPNNAGDKSKMPSSYYDYQTGFRVGLPIIKDKLFFFTNEEITHRQEPVFYAAGSSGSFMSTALAQRIKDSLNSPTFMPVSQYNPGGTYDAGATGAYNIYSKSAKFFNRVDWNINDKHQFSIRNNYITSQASNLERSNLQFQFGNYDFTQNNVQNSTVMELKSRFSNNVANSLIVGYTNIHDYRTPLGSQIFPQIEITDPASGGLILLGTNREAGVFNMRQKTFEITDNVSVFLGKHTFTLGTHDEFYKIDYGFINSWNGRIAYNSTNDFFNNLPNRIRATYNLADNSRQNNYNNPSASFNINLLSAYIQDEYKVNDRLKITPGLRVDVAEVPNGPKLSPNLTNSRIDPNYGTTYSHTALSQINNKLFGQPLVSPRLGFNLNVLKNQSIVLRGGTGLFTGRIPFAWLGYAYYNNGVNFGSFDLNNNASAATPLHANIPTDPTQFPAYNTNILKQPNRVEVDLVDKNFKMPQMWRSSLGIDFKLPNNYKLTFEGLYTQVVHDVKIQQVNLKDSATYAANDPNHMQPFYLKGGATANRVDNNFTSVYLLSNTNKGYRYSLTARVAKSYDFGLDVMAAYTYGHSYDIMNGIRNSMESGWQTNQSLTPNNTQLAYSNFDIRHRIVSSVMYKKEWSKKATTYLSLILTAQSGSPFSWAYSLNTTNNGSGQQVQLAYIPQNDADIELTSDGKTALAKSDPMYQQLDNFINSNSYLSSHRGQFAARNGGRTPWNNQLDLRIMQDINFYTGKEKSKKQTFQITFDIINFTNLLNPKWGIQYFVPNTYNSSVSTGLTPTGKFASDGLPLYSFSTPTATYSIDQLASRWQGQLGLRYIF